jgi:hypothetical protein
MTKANRVVSFRSILSRRRYIGTHLQRRFAFLAEGYGRERTRPQLAEVNSDQARGYSHLRSCRRTMFQCAGFWS